MCCKKMYGVDLHERREGEELPVTESRGRREKKLMKKNPHIQSSRMDNMLDTSGMGHLNISLATYIIAT